MLPWYVGYYKSEDNFIGDSGQTLITDITQATELCQEKSQATADHACATMSSN
jgi:hypothetical protein